MSVFRSQRGKDPLVAGGTTDLTGAYSLPKRARKGRYDATVGGATTSEKTCRAARSKTVRVR